MSEKNVVDLTLLDCSSDGESTDHCASSTALKAGVKRKHPVSSSEGHSALDDVDSDVSSVDSYNESARLTKEDLGHTKIGLSRQNLLLEDAVSDCYSPTDLEFCCATCRCQGLPDELRNLPLFKEETDASICFWSTEETLHRSCCHGLWNKKIPDNFLTLGEQAYFTTQGASNYPQKKAIDRKCNPFQKRHQHTNYVIEAEGHYSVLKDRREDRDENEEECAASDFLWVASTNDSHQKNRRDFLKIVKQPNFQQDTNGMVVADFFAGQGTGRVALEKIGVYVKKYIAVELDPVAQFVLKFNHDHRFRRQVEDDHAPQDTLSHHTEMEYINTFEEIEKNLDDFLQKHGPVDLVLGSAPCQDYSLVNGFRKGTSGAQGSYHVRLGRLIQRMSGFAKKRKKHQYFLVENVATKGDDSKKLEEVYGVPPIHVNAKDYSPTRRYRAFYTNLPLLENGRQKDELNCKFSEAKSCLEDKYVLKGELHANPDHLGGKTHTFMASRGRFDHSRMHVVKYNDEGTITSRLMNVVERTRMMGYHDFYITKPLRILFKNLLDPLRGGRAARHDWQTDLREEFHCFSGLHFKFASDGSLKLASLPCGLQYVGKIAKAPECFTEEEYGFHLVGNAYSVPVVAMLLEPLRQIYKHGDEYKGVQYQYYWTRES